LSPFQTSRAPVMMHGSESLLTFSQHNTDPCCREQLLLFVPDSLAFSICTSSKLAGATVNGRAGHALAALSSDSETKGASL
jgi:hypothetical protein